MTSKVKKNNVAIQQVTIPGCPYKVIIYEVVPHINSFKVEIEGKDFISFRYLTFEQVQGKEPIDYNHDLFEMKSLKPRQGGQVKNGKR